MAIIAILLIMKTVFEESKFVHLVDNENNLKGKRGDRKKIFLQEDSRENIPEAQPDAEVIPPSFSIVSEFGGQLVSKPYITLRQNHKRQSINKYVLVKNKVLFNSFNIFFVAAGSAFFCTI
jgi:hypothetical protein